MRGIPIPTMTDYCNHANAVHVHTVTGEHVTDLCPNCDAVRYLPAGWPLLPDPGRYVYA